MRLSGRVICRTMATLCLTLLLTSAAGCGGKPWFAEVGKHRNSYDVQGEQVTLRMLDETQIRSYASDHGFPPKKQEEFKSRLAEEFPKLPDPNDNPRVLMMPAAGLAAAVIPFVAGAAVDAVRADLKKEAALFEAQFSVMNYERGFWADLKDEPRRVRLWKKVGDKWGPTDDSAVPPEKKKVWVEKPNAAGKPTLSVEEVEVPSTVMTAVQRYHGFEVLRYTKEHPEGGPPAFRLVCLIVPANRFRPTDATAKKADTNIFLIKPLLFQTASAKAKVAFLRPRMDTKIDIAIDATWIERDQTARQSRVINGQFDVTGYDLNMTEILIDKLKSKTSGWFGGVPVSVDRDGKPTGNGTFKITVLVTESDQLESKQALEQVAKFVGDQKEKVVQAVAPADQGDGGANDSN
jgi:hypothetical protein